VQKNINIIIIITITFVFNRQEPLLLGVLKNDNNNNKEAGFLKTWGF